MLLVVAALKLITETALMVLPGPWLLGLLAGARCDGDLALQLRQMASRPCVALARRLSPRFVVERQLPLVICHLKGCEPKVAPQLERETGLHAK